MLKDTDYAELSKVGLKADNNGDVYAHGSVEYLVLGKLDGELAKANDTEHWVLEYCNSDDTKTYITVEDFTWAREYDPVYKYVVKNQRGRVVYKGDSGEVMTKVIDNLDDDRFTVLKNTKI